MKKRIIIFSFLFGLFSGIILCLAAIVYDSKIPNKTNSRIPAGLSKEFEEKTETSPGCEDQILKIKNRTNDMFGSLIIAPETELNLIRGKILSVKDSQIVLETDKLSPFDNESLDNRAVNTDNNTEYVKRTITFLANPANNDGLPYIITEEKIGLKNLASSTMVEVESIENIRNSIEIQAAKIITTENIFP